MAPEAHSQSANGSSSSNNSSSRWILYAFEMACSGHQSPGLFTHPDDKSHLHNKLTYWTDLAKLLERGECVGCTPTAFVMKLNPSLLLLSPLLDRQIRRHLPSRRTRNLRQIRLEPTCRSFIRCPSSPHRPDPHRPSNGCRHTQPDLWNHRYDFLRTPLQSRPQILHSGPPHKWPSWMERRYGVLGFSCTTVWKT